ncbi:MAG TPA: IS21 family transposase [Burkholderiales bacterium]|nr:IS21 family transposase [Burkholderiales bacterium]
MISPETEALILRYHHAERWKAGTIASQLGVHHSVVARVLAKAGQAPVAPGPRARLIDPYVPFLRDTLARFPNLTAARLYQMAKARGFVGGARHFRHVVRAYRPARQTEAYLRLRTLPGEQAQVDWAHFGHLTIGQAKRPLMAFVMVLSYSRRIYLRFFLDARMENFLRGHLGAFAAWRGVPRVLLYDNLKSAVLERQGSAIRFNPALIAFAAHYRFEPRPVAVARGNEKGRVERAIRFIRENFWPARAFRDLTDLNEQAAAWCDDVAQRPCPEQKSRSVDAVFREDDQPRLMALPATAYPVIEQAAVAVGKTPYVRFDANDYSVPYAYVRKTLTVLAEPDAVRIVDGGVVVLATHPRSYDKGRQIEDARHIDALVLAKRAASAHRNADRLICAAPEAQALLDAAAQRGEPLARISAELLSLLDAYGAAALSQAIVEALGRSVAHPNAVRLALTRQREAQGQLPPVAIALPDHIQARDVVVRAPRLDAYDQLLRHTEDNHD